MQTNKRTRVFEHLQKKTLSTAFVRENPPFRTRTRARAIGATWQQSKGVLTLQADRTARTGQCVTWASPKCPSSPSGEGLLVMQERKRTSVPFVVLVVLVRISEVGLNQAGQARGHRNICGRDIGDRAVGAGHKVGPDTQRPGPPVVPDDGTVPDHVPAHTGTHCARCVRALVHRSTHEGSPHIKYARALTGDVQMQWQRYPTGRTCTLPYACPSPLSKASHH